MEKTQCLQQLYGKVLTFTTFNQVFMINLMINFYNICYPINNVCLERKFEKKIKNREVKTVKQANDRNKLWKRREKERKRKRERDR